ncbi:hypothetical protein [Actinoallomurus sp. CA-142502]|uniref:hypothetical protein n=1 Tax=Actinoallomurus sp. CA-142502 TaxID=3239885 RepID=UPI003D8D0CBC
MRAATMRSRSSPRPATSSGSTAPPLVGLFGERSSLPMALVMLAALALAVPALVVLVRPRQDRGEVC